MTIWLPPGIPAERTLSAEGLAINDRWSSRFRGDRPLRIALLNLMPNKAQTETQFARLLAHDKRDVRLTLIVPDRYCPRTTPASHIDAFYRRWSTVRERPFDGLIVTGAPVETLDYEAVDYWSDLTAIMDWARATIPSTLYICWAAQAALRHFHGVEKSPLPRKLTGVFRQDVTGQGGDLLASLGGSFPCPVSRNTEIRRGNLPGCGGLRVLAESPRSGLAIVDDQQNGAVYSFNHLEYDAATLDGEYRRDSLEDSRAPRPVNYYDGAGRVPTAARWRPAAKQFFANWLTRIERARAIAMTGSKKPPAPVAAGDGDRRRDGAPGLHSGYGVESRCRRQRGAGPIQDRFRRVA